MVAITATPNDYTAWIEELSQAQPETDFSPLRHACLRAAQLYGTTRRLSGESYLEHALAVAHLLSKLRLDIQTLAAAVLHDVPEVVKGINLASELQELGPEIIRLVTGVQRMDAVMRRSDQSHPEDHEGLRKLLLSIDEDMRVLLIRIAEQTHDLRSAKQLAEPEKKRIATETMDLYAPLANRLGMGRLKWELEDLSFRYLHPEIYQRIATLLDERRGARESYLQQIMEMLRERLAVIGIHAEISGRPKHIYSIWCKMRRKDVDFDHIYDMRAVRLLVDSVTDCYTALGIVHGLWLPISGEFDDYIARPKNNLYQSLHTAVVGPENKTVEIQIRTHEMHNHAELGVAAHWRYKDGGRSDTDYDHRIQWLRQFLKLDDTADSGEFFTRFRQALQHEHIHVFTPQGKVIDLPQGATPLDFAYHVHSEIGHHCRGAKVDGHIVPLSYQLRNGEQIEILTAKRGMPSRDWLNPTTGYLHTNRARNKVRLWFRQETTDEDVEQGTLSHNAVKSHKFNILHRPERINHPKNTEIPTRIRVQGVGNLVTHIAQCCHPNPGDPIVGYVTLSQGISIHHRDCPNLLGQAHAKLLDASWTTSTTDTWPAHLRIVARDRPGLLRDVTSMVADDEINILAVDTLTNKKQQIADMRLTVEVYHMDQLSRLLTRINELGGIISIHKLNIG